VLSAGARPITHVSDRKPAFAIIDVAEVSGFENDMVDRFPTYCASDGTWLVWDNDSGRPAELGGAVVGGLSEPRAKAAASILARIYQRRLDAQSSKGWHPARPTIR